MVNMATSGVAEAKAKFSAVLDKAESEGPQLVRRRKQTFYVFTREQIDALTQEKSSKSSTGKPLISAWDAMRPSFADRYDDVDFPRLKGRMRAADLE